LSRPPQTVPSSTLVDRPTTKRGKLPKETTDYLKAWLHRHSDHPYPSEEEKKQLCHATGLSMSQVSNWMINVSHPSFLCRFSLTPPARHGAGSWHPLIEQPQALPPPRHTPQQRGPRLPPLPCWSPCPAAPPSPRNRCSCITPCPFSPFRRPTRTTRPRRRPTVLNRTGTWSECHRVHRTNITEDQVALTFLNRDIPWRMCRGKDTTLPSRALYIIWGSVVRYPIPFCKPICIAHSG